MDSNLLSSVVTNLSKTPGPEVEVNITSGPITESVLFVTSFANDMYKMTGKRLVDSFLKFQHESGQRLLVCYENFDFQVPKDEAERILAYPLHESEYLQQWLLDNAEIIPDYLGGQATKASNPVLFTNSWNRKSSRWFRKIAALEYALREYQEDYHHIIWLDSDVYFFKTLPINTLLRQFNEDKKANQRTDKVKGVTKINTDRKEIKIHSGAFYNLGTFRLRKDIGFESGVIGFRKLYNGYELLSLVIECFKNGSFRQYKRWDDGYIFRMIMRDHNPDPLKYPVRDLVVSPKAKGEVITSGPLGPYFIHCKGSHTKKKIMI